MPTPGALDTTAENACGNRITLLMATILMMAAFLAGCAGSSDGMFSSGFGPDGANAAPGQFRSIGTVAPDPGSYRIGSGDVLTIKVFQADELNREVAVSENGLITLPLIGAVQAGGKSAQDLERTVAGQLRNYMHSPQVNVFVSQHNSQKFTVEGSVREPGVYPIKGQTTLMQAIAMAKGLGPLADASTIVVFRQANGQKYAARFNLNEVRTGKTPNPAIQKDDVIYVEESGSRRVLENMKNYLVPASVFLRFVAI